MAKNRIVYAQRNSAPASYDTALIADFEARGWTVTVFADNTEVPLDPAYYDDVLLLVIGAFGTGSAPHPSGPFLAGLPVDILCLCRYTAIYHLALASYGTIPSITGFYRRATTDPRASFASVSMSDATSQCLYTFKTGVKHVYYASYSTSYAGIATLDRTNGYETVYWGYHNIQSLSGDALTLWRAYAGGTDTSPREVRAAIASPLGEPAALVRLAVSGSISLRSPLGSLAARGVLGATATLRLPSPLGVLGWALVLPASETVLRLPSPLSSRPAVLVALPPTGLLRLPSPLGAPRVLVAPVAAVRAAVASPLGALGARLTQPRGTPGALAPVARPRLLADPLPLRSMTALPDYTSDHLLPWVYGTLTLAPLAWDTTGLEWLLADHAIAGVHWVEIEGDRTDGWELVQTLDPTGHAVALLRLTQAATSAPAVSLSGRPHPATGALLTHPADIAEDLLRQCGWQPDRGAFQALRDAWPTVTLGGVLERAEPVREAIGRVLATLGADWSGAPLRGWLPGQGAPLATLTPALIDDGSATTGDTSLVTVLRVAYGTDWAAQTARGTLTLEAPDAIAAFGRIEADLDLGWVRAGRDALALGMVALADRARPLWALALTLAPGAPWLPGDALEIAHPWLPQGPATITAVAQDSTRTSLALTRRAGSAPRVILTAQGQLADAAPAAGTSVSYTDGVATFTILDATGSSLAGASVTLDGIQTRTTDRLGRVQFTTTRGPHSLLVVAAGYASMELEVTV